MCNNHIYIANSQPPPAAGAWPSTRSALAVTLEVLSKGQPAATSVWVEVEQDNDSNRIRIIVGLE